MNINETKSFLSRRDFYLMALTAFVALIGVTFLFVSEKDTVSAQKSATRQMQPSSQAVTGDMLRYALNFRSATNFAVLAEDGISGSARVEGNVGVLRDGALIKGISYSNLDFEFDRSRARTDLMNAFSAMNQLPCQEVDDSELGGKTFAPGVYCLSSARLAGEMILDGKGDAGAIFVFKAAGALKAEAGSRILLSNEAMSGNVFFASNDTATIGEGSEFNANILARNAVQVLGGARVTGRTVSVEGNVQLDGDVVQQTGVLQICKAAAGAGLDNRIFQFEVGGVVYETPVGQCTGPITLPVGPNVVRELAEGRFTNQPGIWSGRFRLVSVTSPTPGAGPTNVNLPNLTATVTVREGTITNQTVLNFTNTFAVNAVIEICKRPVAGDPDAAAATGFFNFTVDALPNQVFPVPMNQCSGPIQVNVPTDPAAPPAPATIRVTELGRAGFNLEAASTFPANRFIALNLGQGIVNNIACSTIGNGPVPPGCVFANPGGGFVTAQVLEGGTAAQTTINFFNRSAPGLVKICKIAGPGIPEGTRFEFLVQGTVAGPTQPFAPGTVETRQVIVEAGPAAQGGFCDFVRDANGQPTLFVVGTNVYVDEIGAIDPVPGVPPGEIRVSRIRLNQSLTGFVAAPATVPGNAAVTPVIPARTVNPNPNLATGEAIFQVRTETREVEYTNFVFNPTLLKICKIAGPGVTQGTPFTFTVAIQNTGGFPFGNQTNQPITVSNVTVQAGPAAQGGFCQFAQGPFTPTATDPPVGTFPVGSTVRVCENTVTGVNLIGVTSPTGVPSLVPGQTNCRDITLGFAGGFNELAFTNSTTLPPPPLNRARFDFDGDGRTDFSIFRPSTGEWWYMRSIDGHDRAFQFGTATDRMVPADYTGDGKTDIAFFRPSTNEWFILRSENNTFYSGPFGAAGDVPAPADFDGDGRADVAVFRPSEGNWYIARSTGGFTIMKFGQAGDVPVPADYDGDGRADLAIYRPSTGEWWILRSTDGAYVVVQFGTSTDRPVPADYTGDGKTDIAFFRPSTREWFILRSENFTFYSAPFGAVGDIPVPGDYDGDGRADVAVWRPSEGNWYVARTTGGFTIVNFGLAGDRPVPASFIP